ncbi:hypothetical protein Tco_0678838 [Tanacetum coccineum]|uniref:RNA-directed DNA polymerase, eukaryota, reverse transcriptase zinc-binding domain protein n=1 Tax=Tanacetum coccineum TaxID=301880 RepID=A0ABQ4XGD2_9ASTR
MRRWIAGCLILAKGSVSSKQKPYLGIYIHRELWESRALTKEWIGTNYHYNVRVLKCFYMASGLKINLSKSKLSGIGVSKREVDEAAAIVGCSTLSFPFQYLGVKIGAPMSRIKSWNEVIEKVSSRLSKWKIQLYRVEAVLKALESLRSNFFNGASKEDRKMVLVRWDKIMASKSKGGLGVSSLFASNRALLFKWIWRLHSNCSSIWANLIKAIHGGKDDITNFNPKISGSIWQELVREFLALKDKKGIDCFSFIKRKLGNGEETSFWNELWLGENVLKISHPRIYALEIIEKDILSG